MIKWIWKEAGYNENKKWIIGHWIKIEDKQLKYNSVSGFENSPEKKEFLLKSIKEDKILLNKIENAYLYYTKKIDKRFGDFLLSIFRYDEIKRDYDENKLKYLKVQ